MSIQRAEDLKREWTDRCVLVNKEVAELRRFAGLIGHVKTVNMNCRLLIEFETPADNSWYDIDPAFVHVADSDAVRKRISVADTTIVQSDAGAADVEKNTARQAADSSMSATAGESSTAPRKVLGAGNPLDLIRSQAASGKATQVSQTKNAESSTVGRRTEVSPLDLIRAQSAAGTSEANTLSRDKLVGINVSPSNLSVGKNAGPAIAVLKTEFADTAVKSGTVAAAPLNSVPSFNENAASVQVVAGDGVAATCGESSSAFSQIRTQAAEDCSSDDSSQVRDERLTLFDVVKMQSDNDERVV